jgi:hypothetical protein
MQRPHRDFMDVFLHVAVPEAGAPMRLPMGLSMSRAGSWARITEDVVPRVVRDEGK